MGERQEEALVKRWTSIGCEKRSFSRGSRLDRQQIVADNIERIKLEEGGTEGDIQHIRGSCYIWETPRKNINAVANHKMRSIRGPGIPVKARKIWTNSNRVREIIDEELRRR